MNTNTDVHILIVEDNHRYLDELLEELHDRGYQYLYTARDVAETKACLSQQIYDVIITDMRLGTDAAGGFAVLELVGITSTLIILTANDTVVDCRRAFKAGAWDYISKNRGDPVEVLHTSIQEALRHYVKLGKREDEEWIEVEMPNLMAKYAGKYIAVSNKQIIAVASTKEELEQLMVEQDSSSMAITSYRLIDKSPSTAEQYIAVSNKQVIAAASTKDVLERLLVEQNVPPMIVNFYESIDNPPSISELIQRGESATLEFKSTLRWSVKGKVRDDDLQNEVCKTVAAFLNSDGGTLLIGVEDKGQIFGLEQDYAFVRNKNRDGFEQHLINLLKERIGQIFGQWIKIWFAEVEGRDVCAVEVQKAAKPAFLKVVEKGKPDQKRFFVRVGNTSPYFEFEEMIEYAQTHWG